MGPGIQGGTGPGGAGVQEQGSRGPRPQRSRGPGVQGSRVYGVQGSRGSERRQVRRIGKKRIGEKKRSEDSKDGGRSTRRPHGSVEFLEMTILTFPQSENTITAYELKEK